MATREVAGGMIAVRGPRPARRRQGRVLAAAGDGWALWVPVELWDRMTDHERAELARRQAALLDR